MSRIKKCSFYTWFKSLLLSSSEPKFVEPSNVIRKEKERRLVLGIILSKYLVQSSICNHNDRDKNFSGHFR